MRVGWGVDCEFLRELAWLELEFERAVSPTPRQGLVFTHRSTNERLTTSKLPKSLHGGGFKRDTDEVDELPTDLVVVNRYKAPRR